MRQTADRWLDYDVVVAARKQRKAGGPNRRNISAGDDSFLCPEPVAWVLCFPPVKDRFESFFLDFGGALVPENVWRNSQTPSCLWRLCFRNCRNSSHLYNLASLDHLLRAAMSRFAGRTDRAAQLSKDSLCSVGLSRGSLPMTVFLKLDLVGDEDMCCQHEMSLRSLNRIHEARLIQNITSIQWVALKT